MTQYQNGRRGLVALFIASLTLVLLPSLATETGSDEPPKPKEVFDAYATSVATVNPVAAAMFKGAGKFLDLVGYFGKGPDPVGDAIKRINERLAVLETRVSALEEAVQKSLNIAFKNANLERIRELRGFKDRLQGILNRLALTTQSKGEKTVLALDAQLIAEKFRIDTDLWLWSDLVLKSHFWQDTSMEAGRLLDPDFKPWPTLEYYTLALVTWMTAAEYASEGDTAWVKTTFAEEINKHVAFLSIRPGWIPLPGPPVIPPGQFTGAPETLPEQIRSRVKGWFVPDKYPENMVCHFAELTTDTIMREIKHVRTYEYPAKSIDELCTVPSGFWNWATQGEEDLERAYGTDLMWVLANRLTRLKDYGTVREPFVGTFGVPGPTVVPAFIYAVRPDGRMVWYRHDGAEQGLMTWVGGTPVSQGWGDFKQLLPGGGNVIHAITREGKNLWYRHNGFNTGANDSPGHITAAPASVLPSGTAPQGAARTPDALAIWGIELAKGDLLATELRSRELDDAGRRGFDIGLAAGEGHTLPGPGKDATRASLPPAERAGFSTALSFTLERNRNAELAATGAAIAKADPTVERARAVDNDVFYWLGFDIATAIFGNPGLGAQGNTATGPGSLKIRDALSPAGQRGFNAAVTFHLGRNYPAGPRQWNGHKEVGSQWNTFKHVFSGGNGVMYAITNAGKLMFYRHTGHKDGVKLWEPAKEVGSGWGDFKTVFSGGDGIVYAITYEGKLMWYKQIGFAVGAKSWEPAKEITTVGNDNWANYKHVFSAGSRNFGTPTLPRIALDKVVIYAIDAEGKLWWYGHRGYRAGSRFIDDRKLVGTGWGDFTHVFALLQDAPDVVR